VRVPPSLLAYLFILSQALRELIFGSARGPSFNAEWKKQNFFFCDLPDLEYGLIQHKVGLNMATGVKTEHHWVLTDLTLSCRSPSSEIFCTIFWVKITLHYSILSSHIYRKALVGLYMIMLPTYIGSK